jgi:pyruvate dehydrogenase (quinone)
MPQISPSEIPSQRREHIVPFEDKRPGRSATTASILVDKLLAWGVDTVFGVVGDGINSVIEALREREGKIRFITVRHEEAAAFMAGGYSKLTGRLGVCLGTTGPGTVHLLNGLADAAYDGASVLVISGSTYEDLEGTHFMQELDTEGLLQTITCYNQRISGPRHADVVVDLACRHALSAPGVAHLTVAIDVQKEKFKDDPEAKKAANQRGATSWMPPLMVPVEEQLRTAAALLQDGKKIAILAGRGALGARAEVEAIAEHLGAPVASALLGRTVLEDRSPYSTQGIGHLGSQASREIMEECDTLLILGSTMPYLDFYPKPGQARCVQIDRDPRRIGLRYPAEIGLTGDVKESLRLLLPLLGEKKSHAFLESAQKKVKAWNERLEKRETNASAPLQGEYVVAELRKYLKDDAVIALDCGAHTGFTARHLRPHSGQRIITTGTLATMAPGLPFALAAKLAHPERQVVAIAGDGGLAMLMAELSTAVKYRLGIKLFVFNNLTLSMVKTEQAELGNEPYGTENQPIDYAAVAVACGALGLKASDPSELERALGEAFRQDGPVLVQVNLDPEQEFQDPAKA